MHGYYIHSTCLIVLEFRSSIMADSMLDNTCSEATANFFLVSNQMKVQVMLSVLICYKALLQQNNRRTILDNNLHIKLHNR